LLVILCFHISSFGLWDTHKHTQRITQCSPFSEVPVANLN
jgi:hypothetical protein